MRVTCRELAGNEIEIVVRDDGRGIDRAAIAARANRPIPDDASLLQVVSASGFSTRDVATMTSGRGLGMEIVRRIAVGELGGELAMRTEVDLGTTFTLRVPVTIAVVDVLSFNCGAQAFVVPAATVEEIIEVVPGARAEQVAAASPIGGRPISLVSARRVLAIDRGERAGQGAWWSGATAR